MVCKCWHASILAYLEGIKMVVLAIFKIPVTV